MRSFDEVQNLLFVEYANKKYSPKYSGIYFICSIDRVLYVGKTENIHTRLNNHERLYKFKIKYSQITIHYLPCHKEEIVTKERLFIYLFMPPYNRNSAFANIYLDKDDRILLSKRVLSGNSSLRGLGIDDLIKIKERKRDD